MLVFDEDYTGPRWVYGLVLRPAGIGCQPDGRIIGGDKRDARTGDSRVRHGTIEYPRELTELEI
jgi:Defence against restriction A C-terminal